MINDSIVNTSVQIHQNKNKGLLDDTVHWIHLQISLEESESNSLTAGITLCGGGGERGLPLSGYELVTMSPQADWTHSANQARQLSSRHRLLGKENNILMI